MTYSAALIAPTGISTTGTILDGYGNTHFNTHPRSSSIVDFAGTTDLTGSGVLFNLLFDTLAPGFTGLTLGEALYNETIESIEVNGSFTVNGLPTITVSPNTVTLLAGQTQLFTLTGSPTPPIDWSTLDPSVATIDAAGLLTAVGGGVTQVQAVDNVGATDLNLSVTVYDFQVAPQTIQGAPGTTVDVPIIVDRDIDELTVKSAQYTLNFSPTWLTGLGANAAGLMSGWGLPTSNPLSGQVIVAGAGTASLGPGTTLNTVSIAISPSAPVPTDVPLTLSGVLFNEGDPVAQLAGGTLEIRMTVDVPREERLEFGMSTPRPNPATRFMRFSYTIPATRDSRVELGIYSIAGRRVRTLVNGSAEAGRHDVQWDLLGDEGKRLAPGVYFAALEWGSRRLVQKVAIVQ